MEFVCVRCSSLCSSSGRLSRECNESKYDSAFGASNNRELVTTGQIDRRPASRQPCPAFGRISDCRVTQLQSRPRPPLPPPKPPSLVKEFPQCPSSATGHDTVSSVFDAESSIAPRLRSPP
ncbi:unnamed protein product, partial [Soboliphyme baturini]|uniref:Uncharacterized protein n=1 Tax=Soboliphyme baturini TaxID=241478 RepID=A0A183IFE5_9BILA